MLFFRKKEPKQLKIEKFVLSENAITFIKKFVFPELNIVVPINAAMLDSIIDLATQWEIDMIDPLSADGCDKNYIYPERERNELADKFVGEITGKWKDNVLVPDFDDLNKRLGLL